MAACAAAGVAGGLTAVASLSISVTIQSITADMPSASNSTTRSDGCLAALPGPGPGILDRSAPTASPLPTFAATCLSPPPLWAVRMIVYLSIPCNSLTLEKTSCT